VRSVARMDAEQLRYADGPSTSVEVTIDAPPESVWAVASDIGVPVRFSEELQETAFTDGATGPAVGVRFTGRNHHPAIGEWTTTCTIVACEPARRFGWVVGDPDEPSAQWAFVLEPVDGATRLTQWMRMGPGRSGINPAIDAMPDKEHKILVRRLAEHRANMERTLAGIRALVDGASPATGASSSAP
jgi:uncharacterized protein YndB with AHSA1/START domain